MSAKFKLDLVSQTSQASSQTLATAACKFARANTKEKRRKQCKQRWINVLCELYVMESSVPGDERENICIRKLKREGCGCTYIFSSTGMWLHKPLAICNLLHRRTEQTSTMVPKFIREEERTKEHVHSILA